LEEFVKHTVLRISTLCMSESSMHRTQAISGELKGPGMMDGAPCAGSIPMSSSARSPSWPAFSRFLFFLFSLSISLFHRWAHERLRAHGQRNIAIRCDRDSWVLVIRKETSTCPRVRKYHIWADIPVYGSTLGIFKMRRHCIREDPQPLVR